MQDALRAPAIAVLALIFLGTVAVRQAGAQSILLERIATGFDTPLTAVEAPGDSQRLFVAEKTGRIWIVQAGQPNQLFLDIGAMVTVAAQTGLLTLEFHPDYETNGWFYVFYASDVLAATVDRYRVPVPSTYAVDVNSRTNIITVTDPLLTFHRGGGMEFGLDGKLYIAFGDRRVEIVGTNCTSQDPSVLVGKLVRLEDDGSVPADNPFVGDPTVRDEIWGFGLREPHRLTIDDATGDMYIADVGDFLREEVSFAPAASSGVNFGWRVMEGNACAFTSLCTAAPCGSATLTQPIYEYTTGVDGCCVIGGYVYRGSALPWLQGAYVFTDHCKAWLRALRHDGTAVTDLLELTTELVMPSTAVLDRPVSFGEGNDGELYICDDSVGGPGTGEIYRLVPFTGVVTDVPTVSLASGGTQSLMLSTATAFAFQPYVVLGSASGTAPPLRIDDVFLPLSVPDMYFDFTLLNASTGPLVGTFGQLNGLGRGAAQIVVPPGLSPALAGLTLSHAYVVLAVPGTGVAEVASSAAPLTFVP